MTDKKNRQKGSTPKEVKSTVKDPIIEVARINRTSTLVVAFFTLIGGIITAFIASPLLLEYLRQHPLTTPTHIPTNIGTGTPFLIETIPATTIILPSETPFQSPTIPSTDMLAPPPTLTPALSTGAMIAQITTNAYEGRAPLRVTFRADSSHVTFPDGSVETCKYAHVCSYTWDVREQNGPIIHGPVTGGSEFSYEFSKRGVFMVVVYVCRGQACGFTSVTVTTR